MKIRNGFVTNSSSSSFIISVTKDQYNQMKNFNNENNDFNEFAKNYILQLLYNKSTDDIIDDKSLTDFLLYMYDYNESIQLLANPESLKQYKKYLKKIENGKVLLNFANVSDSSEFHNILCSLSSLSNGPKVEEEY